MAAKRIIAVVTGTRAEFGLLAAVMRAISGHRSRRLRLRTIVTGPHLTTGTWRDITRNGFTVDAKVGMQKRGSVGRGADVEALGRGVTGIGRVLVQWQPDVVLVLGDRIEALAGACAASVGGYRLAHVHGGDRAQGVADESMRHAISKMAHLHFAATAGSRRRLIRMGEPPELTFRSGSPAVDGLSEIDPAARCPDLIVMQHPIGENDRQERAWMKQTLSATAGFDRLIMAPNGDPGSDGIQAALDDRRVDVGTHLPREKFLSLLAGSKAIVGNSSAGLIEAAVLKVPCVNIGSRQDGREKPRNVVDCSYGSRTVRRALKIALGLDTRRVRHPYGDGRAGQRIADILATINFDRVSIHKRNAY